MKPESRALITTLLDDAGAQGLERAALETTLTELVEAILKIERLDDTTRDLLKGAMRQHPELARALTEQEAT